jgi:hypothetical protein
MTQGSGFRSYSSFDDEMRKSGRLLEPAYVERLWYSILTYPPLTILPPRICG